MDVLLDIAEPGQSLKPHQQPIKPKNRVVGIDLGTTYSLVAAIGLQGKPLCIPDEQKKVALPSVVYYGVDGEKCVGNNAHEKAIQHPQQTITSVKRFMGRGLDDLSEDNKRTPFALEAGEGGMVRINTGAHSLSPVEISAEILKNLKERAEEALDGNLYGAVVTVPAYFDDAQRQATKDAARLAGLNLLRLVNEPTAAALAYGLDQEREGLYAIYDLGGGTFDISILKLTKGVFQVLSTGGNASLGGDDFDRCIINHVLEKVGIDQPEPRLMQTSQKMARFVKETLSQTSIAKVELPLPDGTIYQEEIDRITFEGWIETLIKTTGISCRRAVKDAGIRVEDLQGVVLVGGSTRIPMVRRFVAKQFKQEPLCDLDPDQVVALGAAYQADLLAGNSDSDLLLLDVTPLSLGLETMGELVEKIMPRNTPIPAARAQEFTTFKDGQTAMAIHVLQGEREMVSQCRSLARFELRGIPPMVAGAARIKVTFRVDADGLLTVSAKEETTKIQQSVSVKPSYGLSDGEIERMLREAMLHGEEDMQARLLSEAKVDAERVLSAAGAALKQDGDLLNEKELKQVKASLLRLWETSQGKEYQKINQTIEQLDKETLFFAQRRMDRSVQTAMAGRKVDDFV